MENVHEDWSRWISCFRSTSICRAEAFSVFSRMKRHYNQLINKLTGGYRKELSKRKRSTLTKLAWISVRRGWTNETRFWISDFNLFWSCTLPISKLMNSFFSGMSFKATCWSDNFSFPFLLNFDQRRTNTQSQIPDNLLREQF